MRSINYVRHVPAALALAWALMPASAGATGIVLTGGTLTLDFADPAIGGNSTTLDRMDSLTWSGGSGAISGQNLVSNSGPSGCNGDPSEFFGQSYGEPKGTTPLIVWEGDSATLSNRIRHAHQRHRRRVQHQRRRLHQRGGHREQRRLRDCASHCLRELLRYHERRHQHRRREVSVLSDNPRIRAYIVVVGNQSGEDFARAAGNIDVVDRQCDQLRRRRGQDRRRRGAGPRLPSGSRHAGRVGAASEAQRGIER